MSSLFRSHILYTRCRFTRSMAYQSKPGIMSLRSYVNSARVCTDWNKVDDFFTFTRGRFVVDEKAEMKRRYIRFDMDELAKIAARSVGAEHCVAVQKCPDGFYNKSFILTLDNGQKVIAKVPNPNAGLHHHTTASEVATMDFARNVLQTPVPKVHAWNSRADDAVGAEYIIMEKVAGVQLSEVWRSMKLAEKVQLRLNLARYQEKWLSVSFCRFGGLYYKHDLNHVTCEPYLYTSQSGEQIQDPRFAVGPVNGREWFDCGRGYLNCDRGPWPTTAAYRKAIGLRELLATSSIDTPPKQTVMVCGPGLYQPSIAKKASAIESYLKIYEALLPDEDKITASTLWHNDLHEENIFVDPEEPTKILGIIDWQSVDLLPLFDHQIDPAFIQYIGHKPETLEIPELQDTSKMSSKERSMAIEDYFNRALFIASRRITSKKLPTAYRALEYQRSTAFDLLTIARRIFEFGEAHFRATMVDSHESWPGWASLKASSAMKQSLLIGPGASLASIQDDYEKAMHGMAIMDDFRERLGTLWPDKDAVSHEQYCEAKAALRALKQEVIEEFAASPSDKAIFERMWPFDD